MSATVIAAGPQCELRRAARGCARRAVNGELSGEMIEERER